MKIKNTLKFLIVSLIIVVVAANIVAQDVVLENETAIPTFPIEQELNGVKIQIPVNVYYSTINSDGNQRLKVRLYGDFSELNSKSSALISKISLPDDNCRSYSQDNYVASLSGASFSVENNNALFTVHGNFQVWQCVENITQDITIRWKVKRVGFIKTKIPVKVKVRRSSPIKNRLLSQSFTLKLPFKLDTSVNDRIRLDFTEPEVDLEGRYAGLLNTFLGVSKTIESNIEKAFPFKSQVFFLPEELNVFNPVIQSVRFINDGKPKLEIIGTGNAPMRAN